VVNKYRVPDVLDRSKSIEVLVQAIRRDLKENIEKIELMLDRLAVVEECLKDMGVWL